MNVMKLDYNMEIFNEENVNILLERLGFDKGNYFIAMTKPSVLSYAVVGSFADFANRYCVVCFSESEINLIMLSRINSKKVTELIKIERSQVNSMKLSNILISYMLNIKVNESKMNFQVFKKVGRFSSMKNAIELFKKMYNL